ncbi:unnamed protein product [Rotaria sp. Silwood2]|nr:unnamed protein product [Rotaria sp. Silwood2]CAF3042341.1 unnamed protein product [Rotaria sp. Silwood2]CAF3309748.1 unnamed protein product [Rotaria sp. Silwood2]CAF3431075.1 unnamed protein product [Rotaria sp. Silwood2]CAF4188439.1 unnamed protein product [Rotaria sp. Silwood2]
MNDVYNHPGIPATTEVRLFQEKIRFRAVSTNENTQSVVDNCLKDVSDQTVARLPNFKYIKRNIQRQRQRNTLPQIRKDEHCSTIQTLLSNTIRHNKFLQFESGPDDSRLVIFASIE